MTHGPREETGVRSPDCGGGDLVRTGRKATKRAARGTKGKRGEPANASNTGVGAAARRGGGPPRAGGRGIERGCKGRSRGRYSARGTVPKKPEIRAERVETGRELFRRGETEESPGDCRSTGRVVPRLPSAGRAQGSGQGRDTNGIGIEIGMGIGIGIGIGSGNGDTTSVLLFLASTSSGVVGLAGWLAGWSSG